MSTRAFIPALMHALIRARVQFWGIPVTYIGEREHKRTHTRITLTKLQKKVDDLYLTTRNNFTSTTMCRTSL